MSWLLNSAEASEYRYRKYLGQSRERDPGCETVLLSIPPASHALTGCSSLKIARSSTQSPHSATRTPLQAGKYHLERLGVPQGPGFSAGHTGRSRGLHVPHPALHTHPSLARRTFPCGLALASSPFKTIPVPLTPPKISLFLTCHVNSPPKYTCSRSSKVNIRTQPVQVHIRKTSKRSRHLIWDFRLRVLGFATGLQQVQRLGKGAKKSRKI